MWFQNREKIIFLLWITNSNFCSLLVPFWLLLFTFCSLLFTFFSLLIIFFLLLDTFCSLLVAFCLFLLTCCSLLLTFGSLNDFVFWEHWLECLYLPHILSIIRMDDHTLGSFYQDLLQKVVGPSEQGNTYSKTAMIFKMFE